MTPALLAAGGGALLLVAGGLWFLVARRRPGRIDSPEQAAAAAEQALPGFVVVGAAVGADGAGALAVSTTGRVAAIARHGRRLVAREIAWRAVRSTAEGVVLETGDRRLGDVALAGVDVLDVRRLAPDARSAG